VVGLGGFFCQAGHKALLHAIAFAGRVMMILFVMILTTLINEGIACPAFLMSFIVF
jgi:hypothetical protein